MKLNISTRLAMVGSAALAAVFIVAAVGIFAVRDMERLGAELYSDGLAELTLATDLTVTFNRQAAHVRAALAHVDMQRLADEREEFVGHFGVMREKIDAFVETRDDPSVAARFTPFLDALDRYEAASLKVFDFAAVAATQEGFRQLTGPVEELEHFVDSHIHDIITVGRAHADAVVGEMRGSDDRLLLNVLLVTTGLILLLGLTGYLVVFRSITSPIRDMTRVMGRLADGDKSVDIPAIGNNDEIGDMARAVVVFRENMIEAEKVATIRQAERLEKEQQREQAAAERTRFFAAAGHDLRQPLHAISLYLPALESRVKTDKDRDLITAIGNSCDAMRTLVDSLLEISRLDAGVIEQHPVPVAIVDIFDQLEVEFAPQAAAKSLDLSVEPIAGWVVTDQALLLRMLRNLLSNAIRYTHEGRIALSARRSGQQVVVEVRDSGIGIAEDKLPHIFEEFYQVDNPERDRGQGVGLGLAIIDRLARLLDHPVDVRSSIGRGTVVSLELPLTDAPAPQVEAAHAPRPVDLSGRLAVLVEDDDAVRAATEFMLAEWGCEVVAADSGAAAVAGVDASGRVPDFIVADMRLRGQETGIDAIGCVRGAVGGPVPAMIVTGDTDPARLREVAASDCVLLHKPLRAGRFREELEALLSRQPNAVNKKAARYANM